MDAMMSVDTSTVCFGSEDPNIAYDSPKMTLGAAHRFQRPLSPFAPPQTEINLALVDLRYLAHPNASGTDMVVVTSSDGYLEGNASSPVRLAWPTGGDTRPPTLTVRSLMVEMPEDGSILLDPVNVHFGDGGSLVSASVRCSAGALTFGDDVGGGVESVVVVEDATGGGAIILQGLPKDIENALSMVAYAPPNDWNGRANGAVTLIMDIEAMGTREVRLRCCNGRQVKQAVFQCARFCRNGAHHVCQMSTNS